ncbi:MAG TPA: hypothetical protein VFO85_19105, partial [Vicinamibacteria bacterium]|nr:hypothetical protein [Vicinamibacteria bacterium]
MPLPRAVLVLFLVLPAAAAPLPAADERPRVEPVRIQKAPAIDGRLDDEAWLSATLALGDWLTYNPLNGEKLPQQTEVRAAYDD